MSNAPRSSITLAALADGEDALLSGLSGTIVPRFVWLPGSDRDRFTIGLTFVVLDGALSSTELRCSTEPRGRRWMGCGV